MTAAERAAALLADPPAPEAGRARIRRMSDVERRPVSWLWPKRIARGKLTLISGDPGLGKSFLTLNLAARVSIGATWPDLERNTIGPAGVVLLSAEDDAADTLRPRLDAAGADVSRIIMLDAVRGDDGQDAHFDLTRDVDALADAIQRTPECALAIIDPVSAYLGGTDSHNNGDVRSALAPLAKLAMDTGVAIVAVSHLRKGEGAAVYRSIGSIAFVAAARAAYVVARDRDDATGRRRLLLPTKNNIGDDRTGMAYWLEPDGDTARVAWEPTPVTVPADDALAPARPGPDATERTEAAEWLRQYLADGPKPAADVLRDGKRNGHSRATLKRAKTLAGVLSRRSAFAGGWEWYLPAAGKPADAQGAQAGPVPENLSPLAFLSEYRQGTQDAQDRDGLSPLDGTADAAETEPELA